MAASDLNGRVPEPDLELVEVPRSGSFKVWSHGYPFRTRKLGRFVEFSVFGADTTVDWSIIGDRKELEIRGSHLGPYCYPIAIDLL